MAERRPLVLVKETGVISELPASDTLVASPSANLDGGDASTVYGGTLPINAGNASAT
jgi:hypothetical protein